MQVHQEHVSRQNQLEHTQRRGWIVKSRTGWSCTDGTVGFANMDEVIQSCLQQAFYKGILIE